jgi:hypothetical protein
VLIPDMTGFRDWNFTAGSDDVLGRRLRDGLDIGAATAVSDPSKMSTFDLRRARARRAVQHAHLRLHRLGTGRAQADSHARAGGAVRPDAHGARERRRRRRPAVDYLLWRLLRVPAAPATRDAFVAFLTKELGTDTLPRAKSYMEDALRMTAHLVMSTPEYQIV